MSTLLEVSGVSVSFDGFKAINNLTFQIGEAEMRAVIGPNGAGNTPEEVPALMRRLQALRREYGRDHLPFETLEPMLALTQRRVATTRIMIDATSVFTLRTPPCDSFLFSF